MHPNDTNLNRIKYRLQGGQSLGEEVVPDFSQNLNPTVTYTWERRWEKEEKMSSLPGEATGQLLLKCEAAFTGELIAQSC